MSHENKDQTYTHYLLTELQERYNARTIQLGCALEHIRQLSELVYQYVPVSAAFPTVGNAKRFVNEVEGNP